jgi:hypothetical protein
MARRLKRIQEIHIAESNARYDTFSAEHTNIVAALNLDPAILQECRFFMFNF